MESSLPELPEILMDTQDLEFFRAHEQAWRTQATNFPAAAERVLGLARLHELGKQAAWLHLEEAFEQLPQMDAVILDLEPTAGGDYFLSVFFRTQNDYQADAAMNATAERCQEVFNDMGRRTFRAFFQRMADTSIARDNLEDAAEQVLGGQWASQRRHRKLEGSLSTDTSGTRPPCRL